MAEQIAATEPQPGEDEEAAAVVARANELEARAAGVRSAERMVARGKAGLPELLAAVVAERDEALRVATDLGIVLVGSHSACDKTAAERDQYRSALEEIMRVTDPGDVRSRVGREAWELSSPARPVAREALGLPIGGATDEEIAAKKERP